MKLIWPGNRNTLSQAKISFPSSIEFCEIREDLDLLHIINFLAPIPYEEAFQNLLLALGISKQQKTQEQGIEEGKALFKAGKYQEAITAFNQVLTYDPNNPKALDYPGRVYGTLKDYQRALLDLDRAIALDPNFTRAYSARGTTYHYLQKYQKAPLLTSTKPFALDPNNVSARTFREQALHPPARTVQDQILRKLQIGKYSHLS